ncbi:MAG: PadR family transcriptional regulator [Acidimicrobiales bacterium]
MSVPMAFLGLLTTEPHHGYDLKRRYDRFCSPDKPVQFGQVYATLARLERDGRVAVAAVEPGAGPERKRYTITTDGREALERWLTEPEQPQPRLHATLFIKVVLAILVGYSVAHLLDTQRSAHLARMRELTAGRRRSALPEMLLADYALFHLEADLRWIELTAARVDELKRQLSDGPEAADSPERNGP